MEVLEFTPIPSVPTRPHRVHSRILPFCICTSSLWQWETGFPLFSVSFLIWSIPCAYPVSITTSGPGGAPPHPARLWRPSWPTTRPEAFSAWFGFCLPRLGCLPQTPTSRALPPSWLWDWIFEEGPGRERKQQEEREKWKETGGGTQTGIGRATYSILVSLVLVAPLPYSMIYCHIKITLTWHCGLI